MMTNRLPRFLMMLSYFSGAALLIGIGRWVVVSGFEGFLWYQEHIGAWLPIPSEELYHGTGNFLVVVGVILVLAGLVELFLCPSCPFPFSRKWESPTMQRR
ncbi:MAG: hypothetical protein H5T99_10525 [Moorella sp. (in: Bacteria)]|nr:hypothetical protein [Moorella sp. (in: firmicutes)]